MKMQRTTTKKKEEGKEEKKRKKKMETEERGKKKSIPGRLMKRRWFLAMDEGRLVSSQTYRGNG